MNKTSSAIVRTLLLGTSCLSVIAGGKALAQPTGGNVAFGQATITSHGGDSTTIDQKTGKVVINWDSFSIAAGGTVKFNQPGTGSIALNRVTGSQATSIYGNLLANGQVWIINGNGVLFGSGSQIKVGGLIATTSDIADGDFASGNYNFSGGTGASVVNQGTIRTANGGSAVLSGASVSNQGLIAANTGTVVLGGAAAFTVDFVGDNLIRYAITAPAGQADNGHPGVSNAGTISAAGGQVIMTARAAASVTDAVVNNTGMISATSAKVQNGEVVLDAGDGDVSVSGSIDASGTGAGQTGGSVAITGRNITVADNTRINVSGDAGGGTVRIGGDLHGTGPLQNADNTHVGSAVITADAIHKGNGGTLVVWSNGLTDFSGIFSAKGGALGGNGGLVETSGHTLNIAPTASVDTRAPKGQTGTWLLDPDTIVITAGEGATTQLDGSGTLALGTDPDDTDFISPTTIINALATTNVTLQAASDIEVDSDVVYSSPNTLNLMSQGDIDIFASLQNIQATGGGGINLVAGWDGVTAASAVPTTAGSYGANDGEIFLDSSSGNVFVGSASGTTTAAGALLTLFAEDGGNVQLGYHGTGGGNINVFTTQDVSITGEAPAAGATYAMIGNGALDGSVSGAVTGNIFVSAAGNLNLATTQPGDCEDCADSEEQGATITIGNASGVGSPLPTGSTVVLAADVNDDDDDNGGGGRIILADLAYGDVTFGRTDASNDAVLDGNGIFSSAHNLTLLTTGDIDITGDVQNTGTGGITLVAGWDGVYDPARIGVAGTYGVGGAGTITVGGDDADGDAAIGAAHGTLNIYAANLTLSPTNGNAQVGYHGAGGGDINVAVTQDINGFGNGSDDFSLQLGNGTLVNDVEGNVTGNITLDAGGQTVFFSQTGAGWLGNHASSGFTEVGNVTSVSVSGSYSADYMEADLGTSTTTGGDLFIGFRDNADAVGFRIGGIAYNSPHALAFVTGSSLDVIGSVINDGTGDVTLVAGWDGHTMGSGAQIRAAGAYGLNGAVMNVGGDHNYSVGDFDFSNDQFENISVGSAGGLTSVLTGSLNMAPAEGFYAQLGYHGAGGGNLAVIARGDLTLTGGAATSDYAMIGNGSLNGDVTGAVTGNIDVESGGDIELQSGDGIGNAWIGNLSTGASSGNILLIGGSFDGSGTALPAMLESDIDGGDVTFALTDTGTTVGVDGDVIYNSSHTFSLLTAGSFEVAANIQNSGTGAINVVAGWNGTTFDPAHFGDAGVFGNNGGSITIGGTEAPGNASVGSAGGTTSLYASSISLSGLDGYAQAGYHGTGSGVVMLDATGAISLLGSPGGTAEIGDGATFGSNASSGNVTLTAATLSAGAASAVAATALNITLSGTGGIASATAPLIVAANTLSLQSGGGNVFLSSPNNGLALTSVSLNGGGFTLAAGGAVSQTGAILARALNVSTTSGAINLTSTANSVTGLVQLNAAGAASFYDLVSTLVGTTTAGGDITLLSKGNIVFDGSAQSLTGNVTVVAGWDGTTTTASAFGNSGVYGNNSGSVTIGGTGASGNVAVGSQSGATDIYAANVSLIGASGYAQLGYHGSGGGAILVRALQNLNVTPGAGNAMVGNGSLGTDVTGNVTGAIDVRIGGTATFNTGTNTSAWFGDRTASGTETGNVIFVMANETDSSNALSTFIATDLVGGDFTVGFTGTGDEGPRTTVAYNSSHTLNALAVGNFVIAGSVQNAGTGAINLVAGWDGHTLSGFSATGVSGNGGKGVSIGGTAATGNVALGSAGGTTSIYGASLALSAVNGYAQLGFNGHGSGAIVVDVTGGVTITGGAGSGEFAQIGNGGLKTSGTNNGDIAITAGGDVVLTAGAGGEAYAQIGHGGAESNTGANGYGNVAAIAVSAANVTLNAGAGSAAYVQIGNGGYKSGLNLAGGTANNGGNITITATHAVSLTGNGADAYAQIGNGGSQSNLNAAAAAGGTDSGDIVVSAPNGVSGAVTLAAGQGADAYAQIGNGGYAVNSGATAVAANFTVSGNVTVSDLALTGGNGGGNAYAQIGNGDASNTSFGNVSGDILIDANGGTVTYTAGTAPNSPATIGNFTGQGTVMGTLTGAQPPSTVTTDPAVIGTIAVNTANNGAPGTDVTPIATVVITNTAEPNGGASAVAPAVATPGPLASLDQGGDSSTPNTSDKATVVIADSLDGAKKAGAQTILSGMLKQAAPVAAGSTVHGVPPADQDFSSWGNEALWQ